MSKHKAAGKLIQQKRPNPKSLGLKVNHDEKVTTGSVLIRQRGTRYVAGENVGVGRDHTLFALKDGNVQFNDKNGRKSVSIAE
jgi:large subunit ribosomal protein L27